MLKSPLISVLKLKCHDLRNKNKVSGFLFVFQKKIQKKSVIEKGRRLHSIWDGLTILFKVVGRTENLVGQLTPLFRRPKHF